MSEFGIYFFLRFTFSCFLRGLMNTPAMQHPLEQFPRQFYHLAGVDPKMPVKMAESILLAVAPDCWAWAKARPQPAGSKSTAFEAPLACRWNIVSWPSAAFSSAKCSLYWVQCHCRCMSSMQWSLRLGSWQSLWGCLRVGALVSQGNFRRR